MRTASAASNLFDIDIAALGVFFGQVASAHGRAMLILPTCPVAALCAPQAAIALGNMGVTGLLSMDDMVVAS